MKPFKKPRSRVLSGLKTRGEQYIKREISPATTAKKRAARAKMCSANLDLLPFCRSRFLRSHRCLSFLLSLSQLLSLTLSLAFISVADPDLQIRGVVHPDPDIKRGGGRGSQKKFFSALRTSVWSKNKGRGGSPGHSTIEGHKFTSFCNYSVLPSLNKGYHYYYYYYYYYYSPGSTTAS